MILLIHQNNRPLKVLLDLKDPVSVDLKKSTSVLLFELADMFPDKWILWCHEELARNLNEAELGNVFHHRRIMASFAASGRTFMAPQIGYVEDTPFINLKFDVTYPTWQMSSDTGGIHASVLLKYDRNLFKREKLDYTLNSLAKLGMRQGLFCYSDPRLLKTETVDGKTSETLSLYGLFRFIKQHYKPKWVTFALISLWIYEKRLPLLAFFNARFFVGRKKGPDGIDAMGIASIRKFSKDDSYDVIVPTIGRKDLLYDYLKDLAQQTELPHKVIIVEQNPDEDSVSELDYLNSETWPFQLKHEFIHRTGACNARNRALSCVESEWVVLGDDDNRVAPEVYPEMISHAKRLGVKALSAAYLQPGEKQTYVKKEQTTIFGSGSSVLHSSLLSEVAFDLGYEFGYGEDIDFGMQIRNAGEDVIYCPETIITHLKAPMGGFRTRFVHPWEEETIQPLPSPTIMLYNLKHRTREQRKGYKLFFFTKFYRRQSVKWPWTYISIMKKKWDRSVHWAKQLGGMPDGNK